VWPTVSTPSGDRAPDIAEQAAVADERQVLEAFLDIQRQAVRNKVVGLSEQDARRRLVPSQTTLVGLLKHLAAVERGWFQRVLGGRSEREIAGNSRGDQPSWQVSTDQAVAEVVAEYDQACAESREVAAAHDLDDTGGHRRFGKVSLRWIYAHMIEETARHAGHADILREQIDGSTGDA
jgi:uncharacterized damage-inducible protein DinB